MSTFVMVRRVQTSDTQACGPLAALPPEQVACG